jgi:hypothetical protein
MPYHVSVTRSVVGALLLGVVMVAYTEALQRLRARETEEPLGYGYARDGVNMAATLVLIGTYRLCGFPGPVALLAGLVTTLAIYSLDWIVARGIQVRPPRLLLLPVVLVWAAAVGALPERLIATFGWWVARASP